MSGKSDFAKFKRIFDHGVLLSKANRMIGFNIKLYAVKNLHSEIKKNQDNEKANELKHLLKTLNEEKATYNCEEFNSNEEFLNFLENMFANVDDEDRYGEVNLKTAQTFRIVSDLIEVLKNWGDIPEEWVKKSKYILILSLLIFNIFFLHILKILINQDCIFLSS